LTPAVCIKLLTRWTATRFWKRKSGHCEIQIRPTRSGTFSYLCPLCVYTAQNPHMMKITFAVAIAAAVLMPATSLAGAIPAEAQNLKMAQGSMFRSGGTATTGTAADGMIQMSPSASAQAVSPSAHGKTVAWSPLRSNGTTAAQSRARSAVATKRHGRTEMAPKPGPFCLGRKERPHETGHW